MAFHQAVVVLAVLTLATAGEYAARFPCLGGYKGFESGYIAALMPPDVPYPQGGYAAAGRADEGLIIGDTEGRTPGSYAFVVGCDLTGSVGAGDRVTSASLVLRRSTSKGVNLLSSNWTSDSGPGPAKLLVDVATQYGLSPFLELSDYEAPADMYNCTQADPELNATHLVLRIAPRCLSFLSPSHNNQIRVRVHPGYFTNHNGAYRMPFGSDVLTFHGSSAGFVRQRPQLLLTAVGEGPEVPIPSPAPPTGGPGSVMASNATALELSCDGGPAGVFNGIVKAQFIPQKSKVLGRYIAEGSREERGLNGIRIGDGFHDYIMFSFVSCNHASTIGDRYVVGAQLRLRLSRVFGGNPFVEMHGQPSTRKIVVDMSPAFNDNVLMEIEDADLDNKNYTLLSDVGTVVSKLSSPPDPDLVIELKPHAVRFIGSMPMGTQLQFRLSCREANDWPFTNNNDWPDSLDAYDGSHANVYLRPSVLYTLASGPQFTPVSPSVTRTTTPSPSFNASIPTPIVARSVSRTASPVFASSATSQARSASPTTPPSQSAILVAATPSASRSVSSSQDGEHAVLSSSFSSSASPSADVNTVGVWGSAGDGASSSKLSSIAIGLAVACVFVAGTALVLRRRCVLMRRGRGQGQGQGQSHSAFARLDSGDSDGPRGDAQSTDAATASTEGVAVAAVTAVYAAAVAASPRTAHTTATATRGDVARHDSAVSATASVTSVSKSKRHRNKGTRVRKVRRGRAAQRMSDESVSLLGGSVSVSVSVGGDAHGGTILSDVLLGDGVASALQPRRGGADAPACGSGDGADAATVKRDADNCESTSPTASASVSSVNSGSDGTLEVRLSEAAGVRGDASRDVAQPSTQSIEAPVVTAVLPPHRSRRSRMKQQGSSAVAASSTSEAQVLPTLASVVLGGADNATGSARRSTSRHNSEETSPIAGARDAAAPDALLRSRRVSRGKWQREGNAAAQPRRSHSAGVVSVDSAASRSQSHGSATTAGAAASAAVVALRSSATLAAQLHVLQSAPREDRIRLAMLLLRELAELDENPGDVRAALLSSRSPSPRLSVSRSPSPLARVAVSTARAADTASDSGRAIADAVAEATPRLAAVSRSPRLSAPRDGVANAVVAVVAAAAAVRSSNTRPRVSRAMLAPVTRATQRPTPAMQGLVTRQRVAAARAASSGSSDASSGDDVADPWNDLAEPRGPAVMSWAAAVSSGATARHSGDRANRTTHLYL